MKIQNNFSSSLRLYLHAHFTQVLENNNLPRKGMYVDRRRNNQIYLTDTFLIHPLEVQGCKEHLITMKKMNHDSQQVIIITNKNTYGRSRENFPVDRIFLNTVGR